MSRRPSPAEVFALIQRLGIECQARHQGTLHMAHNAAGIADLQARQACREYCGTEQIAAALLDRRAGTLNPMAYTQGLADAVQRLGGVLLQQSPVQALVRDGDGWQVTTAGGSVRAQQVVISTGAYTEGDWNVLRKQFFRGYYYQIASKPLQGAAADQILPHGQGSWDTRTVLSSIRRDDQGRLLLGSLGRVDNKPAWFVRRWVTTSRNWARCHGRCTGPAASTSPPITWCAYSSRRRGWWR